MAAVIAPATPRHWGRTDGRRWIAFVAVSVLLHLVAFDVLPRWNPDTPQATGTGEPLRAVLLPAATPVPQSQPVAVEPRTQAARVPRQPTARSRPPEFVPEPFEAIPQVAVTPVEPPRAAPSLPDIAAAPPPPATPPPPPLPEAVPPISARLFYKVVALETKNGNPTRYYGGGSIDWKTEGDRYRSDLQAAVEILFMKVVVLSSHSEGALMREGLAPDRYTETPRKKATIATNFNRDARQSITFSASTQAMPLTAGAQDRLSVLFQIGALMRGNAALAVAGARIEIPVAGVRGDVDTWSFESKGIEAIDTGMGSLSTAHLRRAPRPDTNDRTIDVWLAHADGGYPARVLYTEPTGNTIEMTLDRIEATQ